MRNSFLLLLVLIFHTYSYSQEGQLLRGEILANSPQDASIHIINISQQTGTVNSASGGFEISAKKNDTLWFTSVQYEKAQLIVTEAILQKNFISVALKEMIIVLDEVNLSNIQLTGNLQTDTGNLKISALNPPKLDTRGINNFQIYTEIPASSISPENWAYEQNRIGEGKEIFDLNISLDLIAGLLKKKHKNIKNSDILSSESRQIRDQFNDEFFVTTLGIEQEFIMDFLFYLNEEIQNSGRLTSLNSLAFTELLIVHSKSYKRLRKGE